MTELGLVGSIVFALLLYDFIIILAKVIMEMDNDS